MGGQPVWLASLSRMNKGHLLLSEQWTKQEVREGERLLDRWLHGVGDLDRQRMFRMPVTFCLHRALTNEEVEQLPVSWHEAPATHLAGGSVEILWETESGTESTKPCDRPGRRQADPLRPEIYMLIDCGECPPCVARSAIEIREESQ